MKAVLISIQPKWCELIASGKKTIEVRKTKPKLETPFKVYIYCTQSEKQFLQSRNNILFYCENRDFIGGHGVGIYKRLNGKVIGEFVCDTFITDRTFGHDALFNAAACLSDADAAFYCLNKEMYGWHISDLEIYDKPKVLSEFIKPCENDLYCESCAMYSEFEEKCHNGALRIKRPPQSWCYVESKS